MRGKAEKMARSSEALKHITLHIAGVDWDGGLKVGVDGWKTPQRVHLVSFLGSSKQNITYGSIVIRSKSYKNHNIKYP
jgi:hypothetical protein